MTPHQSKTILFFNKLIAQMGEFYENIRLATQRVTLKLPEGHEIHLVLCTTEPNTWTIRAEGPGGQEDRQLPITPMNKAREQAVPEEEVLDRLADFAVYMNHFYRT